MFGGFSASNADRHRSILALLNDDRLTPEQKAAYCYDEGICDSCGIKLCWIGPFKRRPLTNERVWNGICRSCHPEKCDVVDPRKLSAPWMQKLVVPPEVLLAKTSDAFNSLQTHVSKGINTVNDNMKSSEMTEKSRAITDGTSKAFNSLQASVTEGINTLNDSIKKNSENIDMSGADKALNTLQASVTKGINDIKTRRVKKKQSQEALSSLKKSFKNGGVSSKSAETRSLKGKLVSTPFGRGMIREYRPEDDIFEVDLHCGKHGEENSVVKNSQTKLFCKKESLEIESDTVGRQKQSMELNDAYESLEKMRRLNLELECQERGIPGPIDFSKCTICLLNPDQGKRQQNKNFRRIRQLVNDNKAATSCLFCAAPTCSEHACPAFRKEGITACQECVKLFEPEYIVACVNEAHGLSGEMEVMGNDTHHSNSATEERPLEMMMDLYDRVLLLLQYSSQYIESIAAALEDNTKTYNNVNMGASSVGIVSGALGLAAAAALFTPAGPPLLIASLTLGGGATVAQTGTEAVNHFSEPNKFADKIIALMGMVHSLLRVKESLREILTARLLEQEGNPEIDRLKNNLVRLREKQAQAVTKAGITITSTAVLGSVAVAEAAAGAAAVESAALISSVEVGTLAGRNVNMLSKSGTAIARGARFARFAGGALSAATILLEARTMSKTIEQIRAGHPCDKANALREILKEIPTLPTTEQLDEECRIYVGAMSNRVNATSLENAINLIESKAIQEWQTTKAHIKDKKNDGSTAELAPEGASILDGDSDDDDHEWESVTGVLSASLKGRSVVNDDSASAVAPPGPCTISAAFVPTDDGPNAGNTSSTAPASRSQTKIPVVPPNSDKSKLFDRIKSFKEGEQK